MPNNGPQNAIVGEDFGTSLPQMDVDKTALAKEKNMARFAKSQEFKALRSHLEERIIFYQSYLPGGDYNGLSKMDNAQLGESWKVACAVINEFRAVLAAYDQAAAALKEANS